MTSPSAWQSRNLLPQSFFHALCLCFPDCKATAVLHGIDNSLADTTHLDQYLNRWLDADEMKKLATFTLAKRRNEWLAGRICAKLAITDIALKSGPIACNTITIANDQNGRPYVTSTAGIDAPLNFCPLDISISHSGAYAAAAACSHYCGIDIQEPRATLQRVKTRFCDEDEEHILEVHLNPAAHETAHHIPVINRDTAGLNLLWAAKEAVRKSLGHAKVPDFLALQLFKVEFPANQWHIFHLRYAQHANQADRYLRVLCGHYQEYALALSIEEA